MGYLNFNSMESTKFVEYYFKSPFSTENPKKDSKSEAVESELIKVTKMMRISERNVIFCLIETNVSPCSVAGLKGRGGEGRPRGPKFFQYHAVFGKIWQIRMLAPPLRELVPPPRGNPGSVTVVV